jgi:hypothetical protein
MDRERAETYLRVLAEAELRRAATIAADGLPGRWRSARLDLTGTAGAAIRIDLGLQTPRPDVTMTPDTQPR